MGWVRLVGMLVLTKSQAFSLGYGRPKLASNI